MGGHNLLLRTISSSLTRVSRFPPQWYSLSGWPLNLHHFRCLAADCSTCFFLDCRACDF